MPPQLGTTSTTLLCQVLKFENKSVSINIFGLSIYTFTFITLLIEQYPVSIKMIEEDNLLFFLSVPAFRFDPSPSSFFSMVLEAFEING